MQGGKKIAEGGYGCVYYPALKNDGNENNDESIITKLMEYNHSTKNELHIGSIKIDVELTLISIEIIYYLTYQRIESLNL